MHQSWTLPNYSGLVPYTNKMGMLSKLIHTKGVNLISLFDGIGGMACVLNHMNINIITYNSYEIDKFCNLLLKRKYGKVINQLGDVKDFSVKNLKLDLNYPILLSSGSPCQSFSRAGTKKGFNDPRGQLFLDALRIKEILNPDYYFFENVPLNYEDRQIVDSFLGEPYIINSQFCSPQRRVRSYWVTDGMKLENLQAMKRYWSFNRVLTISDCIVSKPTYVSDQYPKARFDLEEMRYHLPGVNKQQSRVYALLAKCPTVLASYRSAGRIKVLTSKGVIFLNPPDIEKAMGFPLGYTQGFSNTQRYKMLGNSFQLDTVKAILKMHRV